MYADLGFDLTREYLHNAPVREVITAVRRWLYQNNPTCLMHPHGFYVVLLGRSETEEWRLHFWPKGKKIITGMPARIHTHNRHIESRVIQGKLINILYKLETAIAGGQPLYATNYLGDRYSPKTSNLLCKIGKYVHPVVQSREAVECGERYCVERNTYHEVVVSQHNATATLVCMHSCSSEPAMVIGLDGYSEKINFKRTTHRAIEFMEQLAG